MSTKKHTTKTTKKSAPQPVEAAPANDTAPPKHECAKYMDTMVDGSEVCSVCGTYPPLEPWERIGLIELPDDKLVRGPAVLRDFSMTALFRAFIARGDGDPVAYGLIQIADDIEIARAAARDGERIDSLLAQASARLHVLAELHRRVVETE